jgi:hypothetical protein
MTQNLLSLQLVSFLVGLRTYQHPGTTEIKVNVTLQQATNAQRGSRRIALLFL